MSLFEVQNDKFRASAGVFITNKDRNAVLVFEKILEKGSRRLPQGGIKVGEKSLDGAYRELNEETGIQKKDLKFIGEYPELITYEYPEHLRTKE